MPVKFKALPRRNLKDPGQPPKYYAVATGGGKCDIDKLSRIISKNSTVSRADIYAVIIAMVDAINDEISDGNMVYLSKLGSFGIAIKSVGAATPEAVTAATIKKSKINYRPGAEIKNMLKTLQYEKKES